MTFPKRAQAAAALVIGAAALIAAACSNNSVSTGTTTSIPSGTSTTAQGSTTTSAGLANCAASDLSTSVVGSQGAAGTLELTFQFKNTSPNPCSLGGYPGAQLYNSSGTAVATTVTRGGSQSFTSFAATQITLAPGADAFFNMGYSDATSANQSCSAASSLWVTPPNAVDHAVVTHQITACGGGQLTVSPVFSSSSSETQTTAP